MNELELSDYKIGQLVGALCRIKTDEGYEYQFKKARISKLITTSRGTTVYTTPKLFCKNFKVGDEVYQDYRHIVKPDWYMSDWFVIDTPMFITKETAEFLQRLVEHWKTHPPKEYD